MKRKIYVDGDCVGFEEVEDVEAPVTGGNEAADEYEVEDVEELDSKSHAE